MTWLVDRRGDLTPPPPKWQGNVVTLPNVKPSRGSLSLPEFSPLSFHFIPPPEITIQGKAEYFCCFLGGGVGYIFSLGMIHLDEGNFVI